MLAACTGHRVPPPSTDIDESGFRDAVRTLASADFEGRRPGTMGGEKTVAYLVDRFRKLGLKPATADGYLQQVPLVEVRTDSDSSLVVSGRGPSRSLVFAKDMVVWSPRAASDAVLSRSELVFVGYGIVAPEYSWNDYAQTDVHGKIVVVMVNDPGYGSKNPTVFRGNAETYYGRWTYKVDEAARHGAAGVLMLHDSGAAGYGWDVVVNDHTGPQFVAASAQGSAKTSFIEGWLSSEAGRSLFTQASLDFNALATAASRTGFRAVPLGLTLDARVHSSIREISSPNVIGILPGGRHKKEYVVYCANWDHLGRKLSPDRTILPGAVDNASGVAGLLMLAQSFARTEPPPDRSIVFIAFTATEPRLLGSTYYVDHPLVPLRDTAGVIELNPMHVGGPTRDVMVFGYGNSELEDYLQAAALLQGRETHPDSNPEWGLYYRTDGLNFARGGVPALYAQAGLDDSARGPAWGQARIDEYMAQRFHQVGDQYSADWDVRGTIDDLRLFYAIGGRLAHTRHFPRWYPNSEFRVARRPADDAS